MIGGVLYKKGKDEILRRCVNPSEVPLILKDCHDDIGGGYFGSLITAQKPYNQVIGGLHYSQTLLDMLKIVILAKGLKNQLLQKL
jgi:hypothetical protein